jgi:hypothetical protein
MFHDALVMSMLVTLPNCKLYTRFMTEQVLTHPNKWTQIAYLDICNWHVWKAENYLSVLSFVCPLIFILHSVSARERGVELNNWWNQEDGPWPILVHNRSYTNSSILCWLDSYGLRRTPMAGCCEYGNEPCAVYVLSLGTIIVQLDQSNAPVAYATSYPLFSA